MSRSRASSVSKPTLPTLSMDTGPPVMAMPPGPQTPSANKLTPANQMSLYQKCILIRERWRRVPGFQESFLDAEAPFAAEADLDVPSDPVSVVLSCLRLGSSLCFLFNALALERQLDVNPEAQPSNLSACKRCAAHFLMSAKKELQWTDDDLFTITQLYDHSTNGMVKVSGSAGPRATTLAGGALRGVLLLIDPLSSAHLLLHYIFVFLSNRLLIVYSSSSAC